MALTLELAGLSLCKRLDPEQIKAKPVLNFKYNLILYKCKAILSICSCIDALTL